jgi:uncharacterized protein (TIGR02145 family)
MKTKTIVTSLIAMLAVTVLFFQSCKKQTDDDPPTDGIIITEEAKIIEEVTWNQSFIAIDSTNFTLTFSKNDAIEKIKVGDIIVSSEGEGLLRRVTSIAIVNNEIIVQTGPATLTELIQQGLVDFKQQLAIPQIKSIEYHYNGIVLDTSNYKNGDETQFDWNINTVLFDADGNMQTTGDQIKIEGDFTCDWQFIAKIDIGLIQGLKEVKFGFESNENINLQLIAGIQYSFEKKYTLAKVNFTPIVVMVGVVPLVFTPQLNIVVGVDGYANTSITTSVTQSLGFESGMQYLKANGWNSYKTFNNSFSFQPPQLNLNAGAEAYLKPELTVKLYSIAGPYANLKLYGKLDANLLATPWWQLYGGLKMAAGVKVVILDRFLLDFSVSDLIDYEQLITQASISDPPTAGFYSNTTSGSAPLTVNFTDQSTNNPISWLWNFGDGNTSTIQNPLHTYNNTGTYTVSLTVSNEGGTDIETKADYISVSESGTTVVANFSADITQGNAPLSVNFTDLSLNNPTSWQWDFGDGGTSTVTNPTHTYNTDGSYTVTLAVTNSSGSDTESKIDYIVVSGGGNGCGGQTSLTYGGQTYPIVEIGNQCWMAENLNYETENSWWYENSEENGDDYGRLYTWEAALTACPNDWHLPTDDEWCTLTTYIDPTVDCNTTGFSGTDVGYKMKNTSGWSNNGNGDNSSGFAGLPGGSRGGNGLYQYITEGGYWWSSSDVSSSAYYRYLYYGNSGINRHTTYKPTGLSVRCVKD